MEHHAANHLHIKRPHFERPARRLAHDGERFRQQRVERQIADRPLVIPRQIMPVGAATLALGVHNSSDALFELSGFRLQRVVGQRLHFRFQAVDFVRDFPVLLDVALVAVK